MIGKKLTVEDFIRRSNEKHNNKYNYSLVDYVNYFTKVKIICSKHGIFEQNPSSHLYGTGCPKCSGKNKTNDELISELKIIYGDKYDYSLFNYVVGNKVKIICPEHGIFEKDLSLLKKGYGCQKCGKNQILTTEEFIKKAKNVHGNKYDYSLVNYKYMTIKVKIICTKHGVFEEFCK